MRLLRCFLLLTIVSMVACNSNRDKAKIQIKDDKGKTTIAIDSKGLQELVTAAENAEDKTDMLKKLAPLSTDQLKAIMPEELAGMKKTSSSVNTYTGTALSIATYQSEDGKELKLLVYDCAGEGGAGIYSLRYGLLLNYNYEDENGYQKIVDFNGQKVRETYIKSSDEYSMTFPSNDRLLVTIEGKKTGLDLVKQAANSLNLKL